MSLNGVGSQTRKNCKVKNLNEIAATKNDKTPSRVRLLEMRARAGLFENKRGEWKRVTAGTGEAFLSYGSRPASYSLPQR